MKSFQMPVTCRMVATTKMGVDMGRITRKKIVKNPPPSMRAALNSSMGSHA